MKQSELTYIEKRVLKLVDTMKCIMKCQMTEVLAKFYGIQKETVAEHIYTRLKALNYIAIEGDYLLSYASMQQKNFAITSTPVRIFGYALNVAKTEEELISLVAYEDSSYYVNMVIDNKLQEIVPLTVDSLFKIQLAEKRYESNIKVMGEIGKYELVFLFEDGYRTDLIMEKLQDLSLDFDFKIVCFISPEIKNYSNFETYEPVIEE